MTKLLLATAVAAGAFLAPTSANACTLETCWFTAPVCAQVDCDTQICWYQPGGATECVGR